ncbi:MAG: alpha-ketoglutarate-dependent dioxygenase AlkB [Rhodomicrobium sp.]
MAKRHPLVQGNLFAAKSRPPNGFAYGEPLISARDEEQLLKHVRALPFKPFDFHGFIGKRRVVSFGWRYDFTKENLRPAGPIPTFLLPVREKAAMFAKVPPESLEQVLINEYAPGAGIGWHRDKRMFNDVVAVSLGSPCILRLRRRCKQGWERYSQELNAGSVYLLRGESRREWEHSVPPVEALRYSITFRNFVASEGSS